MTSANYTGRIIKHYLLTALDAAGVRIDGDVRAELSDALDGLEATIREIVRQEMMEQGKLEKIA